MNLTIITWVRNSLCKIKAPKNPVAPVRRTLPLVNLFLFKFTDLQNDRRMLSGLKTINKMYENLKKKKTKKCCHYMVQLSVIVFSSSTKFTSFDVDIMF